jgi:cytoskeleton protein RodZ
MTAEENSTQTDESSGDGSADPVGGERLAEIRRARDISVREIAKELHLDEAKVRALEENHFDVLGAPVFAKGHLRKYAELVGIPAEDMLADYDLLNSSTGTLPLVGAHRIAVRQVSVGPWVAGIVIIVMAAVAVWWWFYQEPVAKPVIAKPAIQAPTESRPLEDPVVDSTDSTDSDDSTDSAPATDEVAAAETAQESTVAVALPVPEPEADPVVDEQVTDDGNDVAASSVELVLAFSGDCWTEVSDATGRQLYFGLGTAGRTMTLSGIEPLDALLGNTSNVSVRVDGFDYSIRAADRRGNTARLTIYGQ